MPMVVQDQPKGPFAEFASEKVLSRLGRFQESVESAYQKSLPQDKLANQQVTPTETAESAASALRATGIHWKDVSIHSVLGEGGFSFIFKVRLNLLKA